jgi:AraC-like DNA-binding protein
MPQTLLSYPFENRQLRVDAFENIRSRWRTLSKHSLVYSDLNGNLLMGLPSCNEFPCQEQCREARRQAIQASLHKGQPATVACHSKHQLIAIPVSLNNEVLGALLILDQCIETQATDGQILLNERENLIAIAVHFNVVNASFLREKGMIQGGGIDASAESPAAVHPHAPSADSLWNECMQTCIQAIEAGNLRLANARLNACAHLDERAQALSLDCLKGMCLLWQSTALAALMGKNHLWGSYFPEYAQACEKLMTCENHSSVLNACIRQLQNWMLGFEVPGVQDRSIAVRKVLDYLETHLHEDLDRDSVAKIIGISPSRLSHLFKEEMGLPFSSMVQQMRLERACILLVTTQHNIAGVAADCGFCDQSHFTKVFSRRYGLAPLDYRRHYA